MFVEVSGYLPSGNAGAYSVPAIPISGDPLMDVAIDGVPRCSPTCPGECLTLTAPGFYAGWQWTVNGVAAGIDPELSTCFSDTSVVSLLATSPGGCQAEGSVTVEVGATLSPPPIQGPSRCCAGGCVTLAAPPGFTRYEWSTGQHDRFIEVCPTATTTYSVRVANANGCGEDDHRVTTYPPPVPGPAIATLIAPCTRGVSLSWEPAQWRPGSPGGVTNVYRRVGGCAPQGDASWERLATGLVAPPFVDLSTVVGVAYTYLVEAEDAPAPGACMPGPAMGGPTAATCAAPAPIVDPGDPDAARLVTLSPWLRALGYERIAPHEGAQAVTFSWAGAPDVDPATHVEAWRGDRPDQLHPLDLRVSGTSWRFVALLLQGLQRHRLRDDPRLRDGVQACCARFASGGRSTAR
jgi:hypothetical protein